MCGVTPDQVIQECRRWIRVPYLHQGRTMKGVDCVGLPLRVGHALGLTDLDINDYSRTPSGAMMKTLLNEHCILINRNDVSGACILHMSFEKQPRHLAVVTTTDPMRIIHSSSEDEEVVEHILDQKWINRIRGCYRIKGVDYD